jgi:two-component system chemotaxis response regulator CheY
MKALVIDDSKAMRRMLRAYVTTRTGASSEEASDGLDALEVLERSDPFDVALVDWDMPRMTGLEFVRAVRADTRYAGLKLLMVTARNEGDDIMAALQEGADDFLMKPITEDMVIDKLRILGLAGEEA